MKEIAFNKDSSLGTWERPVPHNFPVKILELDRLSGRLNILGERAAQNDFWKRMIKLDSLKFTYMITSYLIVLGLVASGLTFNIFKVAFLGFLVAFLIFLVTDFLRHLKVTRSRIRPTEFL